MAEQLKRNVKITGTGEASGGEYESIRIVGEAVLLGDVRCGLLRCVGNVFVKGEASVGVFRLQGDGAVAGSLQAREMKSLGQLQVAGDVRTGSLLMRGMLTADGLEADRLQVKGAFEVQGLLNADHADIRLYGPSRAGEMGGGTIKVGRSTLQTLKQWILPDGPAVLSADLIEGDRLELSYTEAKLVRGNRVVIGPGCKIGTVEYGETISVHKSSAVAEQIRVTR
jgi:cytoskeletal protein CcmA (bactofilin family)